jgi:hypothetical protein
MEEEEGSEGEGLLLPRPITRRVWATLATGAQQVLPPPRHGSLPLPLGITPLPTTEINTFFIFVIFIFIIMIFSCVIFLCDLDDEEVSWARG